MKVGLLARLGVPASPHLTPWIKLFLQYAIVFLAFILPFELATPWISIGSIAVLTNVELVAYTALALWAMWLIIAREAPRWRIPLALPILVLLLTSFLSAVFAPSENWHALKVVARVGTGMAIFFMTVHCVNRSFPYRRLALAFVLGGVIVAIFGLLETTHNESISGMLALFRQLPHFDVGGILRSSSTLIYPTVASAYLEFIFFILIGWLTILWSQRRYASAALAFVGIGLVAQAIVLTLTRSALLGIACAIVFVVAVRWRHSRLDRFALTALGSGFALTVLVLVSYFSNPTMLLRLRSESDRGWYQARYVVAPLPPLNANETISITVQLENVGQQGWDARGDASVHLFYHWLNADSSTIVVAEGLRTELPRDIPAGESVTLNARLRAPPLAGRYNLGWDMVHGDALWFSMLGWPLYQIPVTILPGVPVGQVEEPIPNSISEFYLDRASLWNVALKMLQAHPLLGVGAGNFRLVYGEYLGLQNWDNRLHANNTYLEMFADEGLLGGIAFLFLVFSAIGLMVRQGGFSQDAASDGRARSHETVGSEALIWSASVSAALASFFIHGITDYFLEFTPTGLIFWMTLGLLVSLKRCAR